MAISADEAALYLSAVGDDAPLYAEEGVVPPMALAAMVMAATMRAVELPPGAVHTAQEVEFARPVAQGADLACTATVVSNSVRRGTRFLVIEMRGVDGGSPALSARATIVIDGEST